MDHTEINWKKNTALFLMGQALSHFGSMIVQFAIMWYVVLKSQSGTTMTAFTIIAILPIFFISPFAGVWTDRYNRKYIINIADGSIAFFSLIVAIFMMFGIDSYVILFICSAVRSIGMGVQQPAVNSFIPQIVPKEYLTRVNGIQSSINSFVALVSPMISGALMTFTPLETLFFLDVITAGVGITIVLWLVKVPLSFHEREDIKPIIYFSEVKAGLNYIKSQKYILRLMIVMTVFCFMLAPASFLTPLQVARNFGDDVWRLSVLEIVFAVGLILGGLWISLWGGFRNRVHTIALSLFCMGTFVASLGVVTIFWLYLLFMALIGVFGPIFNTPTIVLLQTNVEPAYLGRVFSLFTMIKSVAFPLGMLLFGPLADFISLNVIMIISGLIMSLLFIPLLTSKHVVKAGEKR